MAILDLEIMELRNLQHVKLNYEPGINIIYGDNGSGKTSILEAMHLLSTGKSFRTNNIGKVIRKNQNETIVVVNSLGIDGNSVRMGLRKTRTTTEARINGKVESKQGELARRLPLLTITPESHKLVESGPNWKRKFVDWGLFHVEQNFYATWRDYRKCLQQRNAVLGNIRISQNRGLVQQLDSWDAQLAGFGGLIRNYSIDYISRLQEIVSDILYEMLGLREVELEYRQGWPAQYEDYLTALQSHRQKDIRLGYTEYGIHRADLGIRIGGEDIKHKISRGQQKLVIYALNLAQTELLRSERCQDSTLLLDDLVAELDIKNTIKLIELIRERFTQTIITTANRELIPNAVINNAGMFHVEHGCVHKH